MMRANILVDWSESFVDPNGNFYCGTTQEQKNNAVEIAKQSDLIVYVVDVHSRTSAEFICNGGPYPIHNVLKSQCDNLEIPEGKSVSPQLTIDLQFVARGRKSRLLVPSHVFYQDFGKNCKPCFTIEEVEDTFGIERIKSVHEIYEITTGKIRYVVCAKHMFNGAGIQEGVWIPRPQYCYEQSIFSVLKSYYGLGEGLELNFTGVVMGICVYQTASAARQWFPKATINIIADGCTHLLVPELGIPDEKTGDAVAKAMCQQIGINYIRTSDFLS